MTYEDMHWKQIKKLVEDAGGVYVNKEESILFLNSVGVDTSNIQDDDDVVLDKRLPYGEINGRVEGFDGARYTQNGAFFNIQGKKIV
jgi:hypothetical protein